MSRWQPIVFDSVESGDKITPDFKDKPPTKSQFEKEKKSKEVSRCLEIYQAVPK
jgi:hypothetical protein